MSASPLLARPGAVVPFGERADRPDYAWADGVELRLFAPSDGQATAVTVPGPDGGPAAEFEVVVRGGTPTATLRAGASRGYSCRIVGAGTGAGPAGGAAPATGADKER